MPDRLEALVLARIATSRRNLSTVELATALQRFAPAQLTETAWRDAVAQIRDKLAQRRVLDAAPAALVERIGKHAARSWAQLAERVFPALALGIAPDDKKAHDRLAGRDAWTAAIAGRALGLWRDGAPPSLPALCDAYAWHQLGLPGRAKRCPPEVRALFLQRELRSDAGPPDRLLRLFAARALDAPRPELRALRDALVRRWVQGQGIGAAVAQAEPPAAPEPPEQFASQVRAVARATHDGVFGDRKVFIASVWNELRRHATWSSLTLAEFKQRLVTAHRDGKLVLARADLVAAMSPELVAASETRTDGASFHFIVREEAS